MFQPHAACPPALQLPVAFSQGLARFALRRRWMLRMPFLLAPVQKPDARRAWILHLPAPAGTANVRMPGLTGRPPTGRHRHNGPVHAARWRSPGAGLGCNPWPRAGAPPFEMPPAALSSHGDGHRPRPPPWLPSAPGPPHASARQEPCRKWHVPHMLPIFRGVASKQKQHRTHATCTTGQYTIAPHLAQYLAAIAAVSATPMASWRPCAWHSVGGSAAGSIFYDKCSIGLHARAWV